MELFGVEFQADGPAVLAPFDATHLVDDAGVNQTRGDFRDRRRGQAECVGDAGAGADAVRVQVVQHAGSVGFRDR